jgi:RNA polymerase sporulation-specific sigma factor
MALRRGDREAILRALERMCWQTAAPYFLPDGSRDDLVQEARLGVLKAIRDFRGTPGYFPQFARMCATRQVVTAVKSATRRKHEVLNTAIAFETPKFSGSGSDVEAVTVGDLLFHESDDPALIVIARDEARRLLARTTRLTAWERECVERHMLAGEPYENIGAHKRVDNALQRARRKLCDERRDYHPEMRVVHVFVDRTVYRTEAQAIAAARGIRSGEVLSCVPRKLRNGRDTAPNGRPRADGRHGLPVWRVEMRLSVVVALAA